MPPPQIQPTITTTPSRPARRVEDRPIPPLSISSQTHLIVKVLCPLLLVLNDFEELTEINAPGHVVVDLRNHLKELLLGGLLSHGFKDLPEFCREGG